MELSRQSPTPARYTGLGIVVAVHAVAIAALCLAFVKPAAVPKGPIEFRPVVEQPDLPRDPPPPTKADKPIVRDVPVSPVPPMPLPPTDDRPVITTEPLRTDAPLATPGGLVGSGTPTVAAPVVTEPAIRMPGAVCAVMPRPEVPLMNWSGEAVLHALATVRNGRVVSSEIRAVQGAMDAKTRRAMQRAVETALAGYQCSGNAMFEQDFAFRLD